jgi:3-phenylpropionate/trans-cinnamate dioxygenase ferredoxin subunit
MGFVASAAADALACEVMMAVELDGRRLLLVRTADDFYVVDEMCTHEDYSLALGCIKGRRIKCSLHGSYFDLATGEPDEEPADEPICSYRVKVENGQVWVDPAQTRPESRCRR